MSTLVRTGITLQATRPVVSLGTPGLAAHNTLSGRSTAAAHPTSAITGLDAALAALQPLDADLTAIAALTTTSFGRGCLALADAPALASYAGIPLLATAGLTGTLTLAKTGTTARTVTFPDAAITVAGLGLAQSFSALQTFTAGLTVSAGTTALQAVTCTTLTASTSITCPGAGTLSEHYGAGSDVGANNYALAFGANATVAGVDGLAIGYNSNASAGRDVAFGSGANTSANNYAIAIGYAATSTGGVRIGGGGAAASGSIAIGSYGVTTATLGDIRLYTGNGASEVYLGAGSGMAGAGAASGYYVRINGAMKSSAGVGGILYLAGGKGGDAASAGGSVRIQTAMAGAGTTLVDRLIVDETGATIHTGGTVTTPSSTQVILAAGKLSCGDTSATSIQTAGGITIGSGKALTIGSAQVVGARGAAVADATDAASAITQLNALLARCRAHGLIA